VGDAAREHPEALETLGFEQLALEGEPGGLGPLALGHISGYADHAARRPVRVEHGIQTALVDHVAGHAEPGEFLAGERTPEVAGGPLRIAHEGGQHLGEVPPHDLAWFETESGEAASLGDGADAGPIEREEHDRRAGDDRP